MRSERIRKSAAAILIAASAGISGCARAAENIPASIDNVQTETSAEETFTEENTVTSLEETVTSEISETSETSSVSETAISSSVSEKKKKTETQTSAVTEKTAITESSAITETSAVPETSAVTTVPETTLPPPETTVTVSEETTVSEEVTLLTSAETSIPAEESEEDITEETEENSETDDGEDSDDDQSDDKDKKNKKQKKKKKKKIRYVTYPEYFEKSLFIGDSICSGLKIFGGLLKVENVAAAGNVAARTLDSYKFRYSSSSYAELDAYSIAKLYQPEDIYLWMGMNDINVVSEESFVTYLENIAENLKKVSPDSRIHIVSITPISKGHRWNSTCDGTNRINRYNAAAEKACTEKGFADWINVHDNLADSEGYLLSSYTSGDGLHIGTSAYKSVLNDIIAYNNSVKDMTERDD